MGKELSEGELVAGKAGTFSHMGKELSEGARFTRY